NLLLRLFKPFAATRRIFNVALAAIRPQNKVAKILMLAVALVRAYFVDALFGGVLGAVLPALLFCIFAGSWVPYVVLGLLWVILCGTAVMLLAASRETLRGLAGNGFGLVSGFDPNVTSGPPLTNWLHEQIQKAAGNKAADPPLTFGDLWNAKPYAGETLTTDRMINFEVVTSNLTQGRPYDIPFETNIFFFDEEQFRQLFPAQIVQWLLDHPRPSDDEREVKSRNGKVLRRLPLPEDMPILIAARMSLSFPILLSAVPVYAVDFTFKANQGKATELVADRCWFSDGGISSNFPIHFFDSPVPRWPTFGITLKDPHPEHTSEDDMAFLPPAARPATQIVWNRIENGSQLGSLVNFFAAIINTMQNWRDNLQASAPDYRDRIVQISLRDNEGGLNLTMPSELLETLTKRGERAGTLLRDDFDFPTHMWERFRINMCAIQAYLAKLYESWTRPVLPEDEEGRRFIEGDQDPRHYKCSPAMQECLQNALSNLVKLSEQWHQPPCPASFCEEGCPKPKPILRTEPKI